MLWCKWFELRALAVHIGTEALIKNQNSRSRPMSTVGIAQSPKTSKDAWNLDKKNWWKQTTDYKECIQVILKHYKDKPHELLKAQVWPVERKPQIPTQHRHWSNSMRVSWSISLLHNFLELSLGDPFENVFWRFHLWYLKTPTWSNPRGDFLSFNGVITNGIT